jgi:hypothetical protein
VTEQWHTLSQAIAASLESLPDRDQVSRDRARFISRRPSLSSCDPSHHWHASRARPARGRAVTTISPAARSAGPGHYHSSYGLGLTPRLSRSRSERTSGGKLSKKSHDHDTVCHRRAGAGGPPPARRRAAASLPVSLPGLALAPGVRVVPSLKFIQLLAQSSGFIQ